MINFSKITVVASMLVVSLQASANTGTSQSFFDKIDFYEFSVTKSSISMTLDEQLKKEQLSLIEQARNQALRGNLRTADGILKEVAKNIYSIPARETESSSSLSYKDEKRMQLVFNAVNSILPHAQKIALEKESDIFELAQVKSGYLRAKDALSLNDAATAKSIIENTYLQLKQSVSGLRSGDRLVLNIPASDTREGWQDAAKRYLDWRFLNQYLQTEYMSSIADVEVFREAESVADSLYEEASNVALQGNWQAAVEKIDLACRVLEKSWSASGIDIGV